MRLVYEEAYLPLVAAGESVERRGDIEVVVVAANDHVAPAHQLLPEIVRADLLGGGDPPQRHMIKEATLHGGGSCGGEPVIEAARQRTGDSGAFLIRMLTSFV